MIKTWKDQENENTIPVLNLQGRAIVKQQKSLQPNKGQ